MKRKLSYGTLALLLLLAIKSSAWAGIDPPVLQVLDGNLQQIKVDSFTIVEDAKFFDPGYNGILVKPYRVQNKVTLKINEASNHFLQSAFTATVTVRVYATRANLSIDSVDKTLTINYDGTTTYKSNASYVFGSAYRVKVKVISVSSNVVWNVWKAVWITNELQSYPSYTFSCTNDAVQTVSHTPLPANTTADELPVSWGNEAVADEYDLEWAYIDSSALATNRYGNPANPSAELIFENNSSRVTISTTTYNIPLLYDGSGSLFYRVRSIQNHPDSGRKESAWSSTFVGGLGRFDFKGHSRHLNWQVTTSFAEEGKRNSVMKYFDGTLFPRQTVTKDNSTNTTIVEESIYDYQGRPAIQVLATPTLNTIIQYSQNFNTGLNGGAYDRDNFDLLASPADYCISVAQPMDTLTGAGQYYSSYNPLKNTGFHKYIPDAKGYPFAQVEFTPDGTGRISRQSGVGSQFKLGSGHETVYSYGTPDQRELDALFGTEVGHYSHYMKNMVRDANGQYTVTYSDMLGRTIATALAGTPPDSIKMDLLPSYATRTITENISDPDATVIKDLVMENKKGLLVSKPGVHQFSYVLTPQTLQLENCNTTQICYDCLYDLQITITDDCNNQKFGGQPFDTLVRNFSLNAIDTLCSNPAQGFSFSFSKFLTEGSYEITKKLSVSRYGMDYYRDSVFFHNNTCKSLDSFIKEQRDLLALNTQCQPTCQSCTDSLGTWEDFRNRFMQRAGVQPADSAGYRTIAFEAYEKAKKACDDLCSLGTEADAIREAMLLDLTPPSGQYANVDSTHDIYSIFYIAEDADGTPTTIANYRKPTNYTDADGNPDLVFDEQAGAFVAPQQLGQEAFAQKFKLSWAKALLPYHPEYCKLSQFEQLTLSHQWDRRFESTETFRDAIKKGYLNPTNNNTFPFNRYNGTVGFIDTDPLSTTYNNGSNQYKTKLEAQLREYRDNNIGSSSGVSMWGLATVMSVCANDTTLTCFNAHGTDNNAFDSTAICMGDLDMAWRAFRQMYLDIKREIVYAQIKNFCNAQPGNITSATLVAANHQVHFSDAVELLQLTGSNLPSTPSQAQQQGQDFVNNYYESNCRGYVERWWKEMKPCNFNSADSAVIIPRLIKVCMEGSDMTHPGGASSVKPSSTNQFRSFHDVLQHFSDSAARPYNTAACHDNLITAPAPYDKPTIYSDLPVWTKPDSCQCSVITNAYTAYQVNNGGFGSFSAYVNNKFEVSMTENDLQTLRSLCTTPNPTCTYLETPITIPASLQCGALPICVPCEKVAQVYSQFLHDNVGAHRLIPDDSTNRANFYNLLTGYFNAKLGFRKTYNEYVAFMAQCNIPYTAPSGTAPIYVGVLLNSPATGTASTAGFTCDTLNTIVSQFNAAYPVLNKWNTALVKRRTTFFTNIEYRQSAGGILTYTPVARTTTPDIWVGSGLRDSGYAAKWYRDTLTFVRFDFSRFPSRATIDSANLKLSPILSRPFEPEVWWCNMNTPWDTVWVPLGTSYNGFRIHAYTPMYNFTSPLGNPVYVYNCRTQLQGYIKNANTNRGNVLTSFMNPATVARNSQSYISSYHPTAQSDPATRPQVEVWYRYDSLYKCEDLIAGYFNHKLNINLTFDSLKALYLQKCGVVFPISCTPGNDTSKLCGKKGPLFPSIDIEEVDNCTDSSFFTISKATELFNVYQDSLRNVFDSSYRAKCLQAYKFETFTVTHDVSEYHHMLYYYDVAGNLVQTIPPEGVQPNYNILWLDSVKAARVAGTYKVPAHFLPTQYRYNTLNMVTAQKTVDAGTSYFWYDRLGRIAISQNSKQKFASGTEPGRRYSYTLYDQLGRVTEVGEITNATATAMTDDISRKADLLNTWISNSATQKSQITQTVYDIAYAGFAPVAPLVQRNLRNRVSYTTMTLGNNPAQYITGTFFTYDPHGNVDTLVQDYGNSTVVALRNVMNMNNNRFKKVVFRFDLAGSKVNHIAYQPKQSDQIYHRYGYDASNKLILVETSTDSVHWERDARYEYYKHGPVARIVLGGQQVQGVDYAYTLNGWIKGINSTSLNPDIDMANDGKIGGQNQYVARDELGLGLNYFTGDYRAISNADPFPGTSAYLGAQYKPLYNGNISSMAVNIGKFNAPVLANYTFDQLNRLKAMDVYNGLNQVANNWSGLTLMPDYRERVSYDANGNILSYVRRGFGATLPMDSMTYNYNRVGGNLFNNRLNYITDPISSGNYAVDIDGQSVDNYLYDSTGNLIRDNAESITSVDWNVYGRITEIQRTATAGNPVINVQYLYDAAGNRIAKRVAKNGTATVEYTVYVRNATGEVMATYVSSGSGTDFNNYSLTLDEQHIFGTNRLGLIDRSVDMKAAFTPLDTINFFRGFKNYELTNHLSNVLVTLSDKKLGHNGGSDTVDYYNADVVTATDYYPFGMIMPNRKFVAGSNGYRYGFNRKENDNEIKGDGNQLDYGMRIYDPRAGRFLSVDPLTKDYAELTTYQFASNSPIGGIDLDGGEILPVNSSIYLQKFSGSYTFMGKVQNNYGVEIKYNNIPKALQNPNTQSLKFTKGGPVTAFGRDWDVSKDGYYLAPEGRYHNPGPAFWGASLDAQPRRTASTDGRYEFKERTLEANSAAASRVASAASAPEHIYGMWSNQSNTKVWNAMAKEQTNRAAFYQATNIVDKYLNNNRIGEKSLTDGQGRVNLVNFITDGTLPMQNTKIESLSLPDLESNLKIIHTGIQILFNERLEYQQKLDNTISNLITAYKAKGGKIDFDSIYRFKRPK